MFTRFITNLMVLVALLVPAVSRPVVVRLAAYDHSMAAGKTLQQPGPTPANSHPQTTVQISIDTVADVLIENSDGKRIGFDFSTKNFVNEIPGARNIDRETSSTFVLPSEKPEKTYKISVSGKSGSALAGILSIAGPGFITGFRSLPIPPGKFRE